MKKKSKKASLKLKKSMIRINLYLTKMKIPRCTFLIYVFIISILFSVNLIWKRSRLFFIIVLSFIYKRVRPCMLMVLTIILYMLYFSEECVSMIHKRNRDLAIRLTLDGLLEKKYFLKMRTDNKEKIYVKQLQNLVS